MSPKAGGHRREEDFRKALERLEKTIERALAETGMSEEELSRLFDLNQSLPEKAQEPAATYRRRPAD